MRNDNVRVHKIENLVVPQELLDLYPANDTISKHINKTRQSISNILSGDDKRLLVVIGPCSIHDPKSALEYANFIKAMREDSFISKHLELVMRVYFEKPRTTLGWKGFINDPYLDGSFNINEGLALARKLLLDINRLGVPTAGEFLDIITPQYFTDLMSWGAIGARTTESQLHREMASGLSCPIGFKNATNGSVGVAIDAMISSRSPHHFLGVNKQGQVSAITTMGNQDTHIILRGGNSGTNYDEDSVKKACLEIEKSGFRPHLMIDCSHSNCQKQFKQQIKVVESIVEQINNGSSYISGVMIESHLVEGRQDIIDPKNLTYGQSVTDPCINIEDSRDVLIRLAKALENKI